MLQVQSMFREDLLEESMTAHSSIIAWRIQSHGQRSLMGYSPWGRKESDMTEWAHTCMITEDTFSQQPDLFRVSACSIHAFLIRWKHWECMSLSIQCNQGITTTNHKAWHTGLPAVWWPHQACPSLRDSQLPLLGMFGPLDASWLAPPYVTSLEINYSKLPVTLVSPWFCFLTALVTSWNDIKKKISYLLESSVQLLSRVWLFATSRTAACQASLSITNSQSLLKHMFIKWVIPSNHLILCRPLLLLPSIFPSIRVFSSESVLRIRWPKYWSFSFSISPSNEYSGLISFRTD